MLKAKAIYLLLCLFCGSLLEATENTSAHWNLSGQLSLNSQWYHMNSDELSAVQPRQPGNLHRFMLTPTLSYGEFRLPVRIIFSSRQTNSVSMRAAHQGFQQFLQNPINTFSVSPSYRWARAVIGSQTVSHSSFTTGDAKLFGAALELTPGKWNFSAFHGTSQRVIKPDSILRIPGAFQRNFSALKIGYGQTGAFHVYINLAMMEDQKSSLEKATHKLRPQEGLAASLVLGIPIGNYLLLTNEVALSFFTRDKNAATFNSDQLGFLSSFYQTNLSSRTDYAVQSALALNRGTFDLSLKTTYVGDGFVAPGFPYMQTDRFDITLNPTVRLWSSRLILSANVGHRQNNLSDTRLQSTSHLLMNFTANARVSQNFGLNASYANFGMRTTFTNDTLRLEVVSSTLSLSSWLNIDVNRGMHQLSGSLSLDQSEDTNLLTSQQEDRQTFSFFVSHAFIFDERPMNTEFSVSYLKNNARWGVTNFTLQPGLTYRFFNRSLQSSLRLAYVQSSLMNHSADKSFMIRPGLRYNISRQVIARADASLRIYRYGSARPGTGFNENIFRTTISYRF